VGRHPPDAQPGLVPAEPGAGEGLISIAAPVRNSLGQTVAALNISGQANRTSAEMMQNQLLPQLLRT
jgi:DNA-binding IclR family transcriptional regulator